jgi:2-dehydropantoate 2-reductase
MKISIFGAGAVGSFYGAELSRAGKDVTLIGRGAHLEAMIQKGLTIRLKDGTQYHSQPACTDNPESLGTQDVVIFVVKAHQLEYAAQQAAPLLGPNTLVVAAQNGIPWWYTHKEGGPLDGKILNSVDPGGKIRRLLDPDQTLGAVINGSCSILEPGVIFHPADSRQLTVGEPGHQSDSRCTLIGDIFRETTTDIRITDDIRKVVWQKIMSNIGGSMICVLTRSPLGKLNANPGCMRVVHEILKDANNVCVSLGYDFSASNQDRVQVQENGSPHKPSTLQDLEAGKPMEIDSIVGAVAEIGRSIGQPTPIIDALYAVVRRLAEETKCYPNNTSFTLE